MRQRAVARSQRRPVGYVDDNSDRVQNPGGAKHRSSPTFETVEELKEELALYLLCYNTERPHQGLGGKTPLQAL